MRALSLVLSLVVSLSTMPGGLAQQSQEIQLEKGTMVRTKLEEDISTKTSSPGQKLRLSVLENVMAQDGKTIAIQEGAPVTGYIMSTDPAEHNKGGTINIELTSVNAVDGSKIPLRGAQTHTGRNGPGFRMWYASGLLGMAVVGLTSAATASSRRGQDAKIQAGTIIPALVDKDMNITIAPTAKINSISSNLIVETNVIATRKDSTQTTDSDKTKSPLQETKTAEDGK